MHSVVRLKCMDYMVKNRDYFSQFVTEDYMSYINRKRQDSCYGNQLEMQAMSEMYNRAIEVYIYSIGQLIFIMFTQKYIRLFSQNQKGFGCIVAAVLPILSSKEMI